MTTKQADRADLLAMASSCARAAQAAAGDSPITKISVAKGLAAAGLESEALETAASATSRYSAEESRSLVAQAHTAVAAGLVVAGRPAEALAALAVARGTVEDIQDLGTRASELSLISRAFVGAGDLLAARSAASEARALVNTVADPKDRVWRLVSIAEAFGAAGEEEAAREAATTARAAAGTIEDSPSRGGALTRVALSLARLGAWQAAQSTVEVLDKPEHRLQALAEVAETLAAAGEMAAAREAAHTAWSLVDTAANDFFHRDFGLSRAAEALAAAGDSESAMNAAESIGEADRRAIVLARLAETVATAGDTDAARQVADFAVASIDAIGEVDQKAEAYGRVAAALAIAGDSGGAQSMVMQTLRTPGRMRPEAMLRVVRALVAVGDMEAARSLGGLTRAFAQDVNDPFSSPDSVLKELATSLAAAGDAVAARGAAAAIGYSPDRARALAHVAVELVRLANQVAEAGEATEAATLGTDPESGGDPSASRAMTTGVDAPDPERATVPQPMRVTAVALGEFHGLALRQNGTVVSWGRAYKSPDGLEDAVAVAAGSFHSLVLRRDGTVVGWGESGAGQAEPPTGLSRVKAIAAGRSHSLALREDGTVVAWGANVDGQCDVPFGLNNVVAIAAGAFHSLALRADGTVAAWGHPDSDQRHVPPHLSGVVAIAAGYENSSAIRADGSVVDWGVDRTFRSVPDEFYDVVQLVYGWRERLALRADGTIVAGTGEVRVEQLEGRHNFTAVAGSVTANHNSFLALDAEGQVSPLWSYIAKQMEEEGSETAPPGPRYPALDLPPDLIESGGETATSPGEVKAADGSDAQTPSGQSVGMDLRDPGSSLFQAAMRGDRDRVQNLLEHGMDINAVDQDGDGVLRWLVGHGDLEMLRLLLERGADPNAASTSASGRPGVFVLHAFAEHGWPEGIHLLVEHGALVDTRGTGGITPIMLAAGRGHDSSVEALNALGANLDAVDDDGDSVLYYAAEKGYHTTVKLLLELGADASPQPAKSGHTPLTAAASLVLGGRRADVPVSNFTKIVVGLLRAGADAEPMYRAGFILENSMNRYAPLDQVHQLVRDEDLWHVVFVVPEARASYMTTPALQTSNSGSDEVGHVAATSFAPPSRSTASTRHPPAANHDDARAARNLARTTDARGCYVATAVYGSYDCPEVRVLRRWRDTRLATTTTGQQIIRVYYSLSPKVVRAVGSHPWFSGLVRRPLDRLVRRLRASGYSSLPYSDR